MFSMIWLTTVCRHLATSRARTTLARRSEIVSSWTLPSYSRKQFITVKHMLGQDAVGIARIAKETGLTRQTIYRIKDDPVSPEAALAAWACSAAPLSSSGLRDRCHRTEQPRKLTGEKGFIGVIVEDVEISRARTHHSPRLRDRVRGSRERKPYGLTVL
jgi:hypothetical protein